jgi:arylsulfatase A-like enzyme
MSTRIRDSSTGRWDQPYRQGCCDARILLLTIHDHRSIAQKALFARQAEVYADFLEHTDYEVGRLVDAIEAMGQLDKRCARSSTM